MYWCAAHELASSNPTLSAGQVPSFSLFLSSCPTIDWGSYQPQKLQGRRMRALDWCLVSIMHGWQVQGRRGTRGDACCGESQLRAGCGADYGDPLLVGLSSADWGVSATGYDLPRIIFRLRPTILRVRLNHRRGQLTRQG